MKVDTVTTLLPSKSNAKKALSNQLSDREGSSLHMFMSHLQISFDPANSSPIHQSDVV
jgi:hypothetical protein